MGMWTVFLIIVVILLVFDLGLFNRQSHEIGVKESLSLSAFYVCIALLFGLYVWYSLGSVKATQYYTGYFVEQSLSLDNLFVFSLIFKYFAVPKQFQHRVLFWGIIGVFVLRGLMIFLGATLVESFSWMLYLFGGLLVVMGLKLLFVSQSQELNMEKNFLLKLIRKYLPMTPEYHGSRFMVGKKFTPLFVVLLMVDVADIIFAVDSIPAIFVITTDPYIVYTSNMFAILGLRALYFALDAILSRFIYLQQALAIILIFIGSKVFIAKIFGLHEFPPLLSLGATIGLLAIGIGCSLWKTRYGHKT